MSSAERNQPSADEPTAPAGLQRFPDQLEEIIVTAERRTSTTQRTAASLSVRSGEDLLQEGRYQLKDILETVPGITGGAAENSGTSDGSGTDNPASGLIIRGVPSNTGVGGGATSVAAAAALYTDGIYGGVGSTFDIDRVEILRGPQGTLYGRSATSGVVAIKTRDPDLDQVNGNVSAEVGSYLLRHYTGGISVPVVRDMLAVRVSGNYYKQGGYYFDNMGGGRTSKDARVKVLYKPADNFTALLGFALEDNNTYYGGSQIFQETNCNATQPTPGKYCITPDIVTPGYNKSRQYWGEFNLDLESFGITYIPAYRTWEQNFTNDSRNSPADKVYQTIRTPSDYFHTEEIRFHSNSGSALQWQTGGLYYYNKLHDLNTLTVYSTPTTPAFLAFNADNHKTTLSLGAFAEATYSVTPSTRFTGGVRYDYTSVQTDEVYQTGAPPNLSIVSKSISGDAATREFGNVTYKARIEHDLAPANLIYASVSTGVSPGDVAITTDANYQPTVLELQAETLTAFEIGSKNRFLGGKLQVNGAVFYNDYSGYQVGDINVSGNDFNPAFAIVLTKLRSYGLELEAVTNPWANGRFTYSMSYTDAQLRDIPAQYQPFFAHSRVPGVPPFQATLAYDHGIPLDGQTTLSLHGDVRYRSPYDTVRISVAQLNAGAEPYIHTGGQFIGNLGATLAFSDTGLSFTGYVRNVTDNRYNSLGSVHTIFGQTQYGATLYEPRTYGVTASFNF
ncbi:putative outer membrane salicin receptor [Nitrospirillum viridazoti Y2]|nr:putative outer membrane salicin receptor [Nitrospirillum amazonense Y2]